MDGPEPTGTCRLEGQTCQTSLGSFGYVVSCGQGCVCGAPDRNHRWRARSLKAYRLLYSFDLCTGLSSRSGATCVASSRPAIVILGSLRSSLGFGGVVGLPSPFVASCRGFCSQLIAFLAFLSPAPGFFCVDAGLPTSSPLGVLFRFSPIPSGVGFSSSACHGEAPNSCIGGAGATASRQDGFILHSRLFLSGAPACHGDGCIPVSTALLKAERYHEYLRGVSVVQGLSPWLLPVTAVSVMGDLSHASAVRTLGDQPVPTESVCLSWPVPLPVVCVREYLRGVSVVQGLPPRTALPVAQPTVFSILEAFWLSLLRLLAACLVPLARSFLALLFLALLRVLAVPWRLTTPFGRACCFPLSGANTALLQPLGQVARAGCVLTWTPWRDRKGRLRPKCGHARPTSCLAPRLWLALLSGLTLPCRVGPGPLSGIGAAWVLTTSLPLVHGAEAPEDLPAPSADEFDSAAAPDEPAPPEPRRLPDTIADGRVVRANDYISGEDPPRGPPAPLPVRVTVDNAVRHTRPMHFREAAFSVWVGTPYHVPETLQFPLRLPCDIEDALDATERHVQHLRLDYCTRAIAVRPQPFASCAAMLLAPDWSTYSALAVVCLDLRDLGDQTDGPVLVSYITRPTCLAELCREASVHDPRHCRVYVGTDPSPLQPDEEIHLASGCLVTFMRTDRLPCFSNDLQYRLQFPHIWDLPPRFPMGPAIRSSLLLLHSSGRYLYRPQATHDPGDVAAARFVGVDRAAVDFHTPRPGSLERVMYRSIRVRGVIAIAERLFAEQCVVFLDLRQVAEGVQFVILERPHILLTDFPRLLNTRPPPGWVLQISGGRRRRDRIDVAHLDTLTIGYKYICDSDASEPSFDPTTNDEEGEDSESSDPPSDRSVPCSAATTRSRSRSRQASAHRAPSSDPSYEGNPGLSYRNAGDCPQPALAGSPTDLPARFWMAKPWSMFHGARTPLPLDDVWRLLRDKTDRDLLQAHGAIGPVGSPLADAFMRAVLPAFLQCKLLSEPVPHNLLQDRRLYALRNAIEFLGESWRYHALNTRLFASLQISDYSSSEEDQDARMRRASFVICVPGYVLERIVIEVSFPATIQDVVSLLRPARQRDRDARFPHLTPATPQPLDGSGVFVATPSWCTRALYVCIDATRLDGRLFAVRMPAYVDKEALLDAVGVSRRNVTVYVGNDQAPLQLDVLAHVVTGTTITLVPAADRPPLLWDLGQMLLDAGHWSSHVVVPDISASHAYCLVWESRHQLFRADPADRGRLRQCLAAAVGVDVEDVDITPANPRATDVAVTGVPCHTTIAITDLGSDTATDRPRPVLLDGRPIQEGWLTWQAYNGLVYLPDLRRFLQPVIPPGHSLCFAGAPDLGTHLQVLPGTVVILDFVLRPPPMTRLAPRIMSQARSNPDTPALGQEDRPSTSPAGPPVPDPAPALAPAAPAETPQEGGSFMAVTEGGVVASAIFLVFAPGYLPELLEVDVTFPAAVSHVIAAVGAARSPDSVGRFPHLLEVNPQPDITYGTLLALPAWPTIEVLVYFDLRGLDDRYFALNVPAAMTYASLLAVADVPAHALVDIYVRDMPWPLGPDVRVELLTGDLIVMTRPAHPVLVHASLRDMLQTAQGWATELDIPGEYGDRTWLVTDHEPVRYDIDRSRAADFRRDVAAALDVSSATLLLQPVWPHVLNFADHGLLIRSVLIAVEPPPLSAQGPGRWIVCLLDMRPILLGFVAAYAPDGLYHVTGLLQRLQGFCPPGFEIRVLGGHRRHGQTDDYRTAFAGEVFTVTYAAIPAGTAQPTPAHLANAAGPRDGADPAHDPGPDSPAAPMLGGAPAPALAGPCSDGSGNRLDRRARQTPACAPSVLVGGGGQPCQSGLRRCLAVACLALFCQPLRAVQLLGPLPGDAATAPAPSLPGPVPHRFSCFPGESVCSSTSFGAVRQLPTPCRRRPAKPAYEDVWHEPKLVTLLEECASRSDEWAFLAVTLLDTLLEHTKVRRSHAISAPVALRLEAAVPLTQFQAQALELAAILPAANASAETDWLDNDLDPLLCFEGASLALRTALLDVPLWRDAPANARATHLDVFTDGSASGGAESSSTAPAGWAFTVWVVTAERSYFHGAAYSTAVPPDTPYCLGESLDTPLQSELLGLCWALAWLFEYGGAFQLPCNLRFDCQAAGYGAFCQAVPAAVPALDGYLSLSHFATILRQCVCQRLRLHGAYVPGHAGHLGNELSDCFAKFARRHILPLAERVLPDWPAKLSQHPLVRWAWLCAAPVSDLPTLFAFEPTARYMQQRPPVCRPSPAAGLVPATPTTSVVRVEITSMTYNVLTLLDGQPCQTGAAARPAGLRLVGKRHLITQQCEARGVHLLGMQETRLQDTAILPDPRYILLHAAADERGHFGCALWLSACHMHTAARPPCTLSNPIARLPPFRPDIFLSASMRLTSPAQFLWSMPRLIPQVSVGSPWTSGVRVRPSCKDCRQAEKSSCWRMLMAVWADMSARQLATRDLRLKMRVDWPFMISCSLTTSAHPPPLPQYTRESPGPGVPPPATCIVWTTWLCRMPGSLLSCAHLCGTPLKLCRSATTICR